MKRRSLALFLLVGIVAGSLGIGILHDQHVQHSRTFRFMPPGHWGGPPLRGGWFADVICVRRLPNSEVEARIVSESVFMVDVQEIEIDGRAMQDITLRVTAIQAERLREAQSAGVLQYSLCRPDESKPMIQKMREYLLGPRKVTAADILKGE